MKYLILFFIFTLISTQMKADEPDFSDAVHGFFLDWKVQGDKLYVKKKVFEPRTAFEEYFQIAFGDARFEEELKKLTGDLYSPPVEIRKNFYILTRLKVPK